MSSRLLTVRRLPALLIILLLTSTAFAGHESAERGSRGQRGARVSAPDTSCSIEGSRDVEPRRKHRSRRAGRNVWKRNLRRWVNAQIIVPSQTWTPGHYEWKYESYCVEPAHYEKRWVPPVTETRYQSCGTPYTVVIREGYYEDVWVPARYEQRKVRVWVPGAWSSCDRP